MFHECKLHNYFYTLHTDYQIFMCLMVCHAYTLTNLCLFSLLLIATHTTLSNDDDEDAEVRQAAVNTIIVCLLSILICVGPCFVLTFIGKYRQEQLRQKIIEEEKECTTTNVLQLGPSKLYREQPRHVLDKNCSEAVLVPKNSTSSVGSIYSIGGEHCFKQEFLGAYLILYE